MHKSVRSVFTLRGIPCAVHILKTVQKLSVERWNNGVSMQTNRSRNILLALVAHLVCACVLPVSAEWQCAVWWKSAKRSMWFGSRLKFPDLCHVFFKDSSHRFLPCFVLNAVQQNSTCLWSIAKHLVSISLRAYHSDVCISSTGCPSYDTIPYALFVCLHRNLSWGTAGADCKHLTLTKKKKDSDKVTKGSPAYALLS